MEGWDTKNNTLLARCNPIVPVNIDLRGTCDKLEQIAKEYRREVEKREQAPTSQEGL